jgi:hypothetical protein
MVALTCLLWLVGATFFVHDTVIENSHTQTDKLTEDVNLLWVYLCYLKSIFYYLYEYPV